MVGEVCISYSSIINGHVIWGEKVSLGDIWKEHQTRQVKYYQDLLEDLPNLAELDAQQQTEKIREIREIKSESRKQYLNGLIAGMFLAIIANFFVNFLIKIFESQLENEWNLYLTIIFGVILVISIIVIIIKNE